jgi:hypothetical protein
VVRDEKLANTIFPKWRVIGAFSDAFQGTIKRRMASLPIFAYGFFGLSAGQAKE